MLLDLLDILFYLLIIVIVWLGAYSIYFAAITFQSSKSRRFVIEQKYHETIYNNNLIVIIYAHNDEKTIVPMLEMLNKQKYPRNHFQTHIVLDNCGDNSSNILEFIGGAKIWRVGDNVTIGKDEAITWVLERLASSSYVDAFVFLNGNRVIDEDFLKVINADLFKNDVITGQTAIIDTYEKNFKNNVIYNYHKFSSNVINCGRSLTGLTTIIDSDLCVIKQKVLQALKVINFKNAQGEYEYTMDLAENGFVCKYNPMVQAFINIEKFKLKTVSLKFKLKLLFDNFKKIFGKPLPFVELILSTLYPGFFVTILMIICLISLGYSFYFEIAAVSITALILMTTLSAFFISKAKFPSLLGYQFYSLAISVMRLPLVNFFSKLMKKNSHSDNAESHSIDVFVTDGKNNLECRFELISEEGLCRTTFRFKKKRYSSSSHIRMYDAIKEIIDKLAEHGLRVKICQSCGYFTPKIDGSTNMIKGHCHRNVLSKTAIRPDNTLLWNTCPYFIPLEANKVIDINEFKSFKDE